MNTTSASIAPRLAFRAAIAAQVLIVAIVVFGDIGFDHPGRFGLDFGHLLLLGVLWLVTTVLGFVFAWQTRNRGPLVVQCGLLATIAGGAWLAMQLS